MKDNTRKVDKARYDAVMAMRVCPNCKNYVVIDVHRRSVKDVMNLKGSKYLGHFHACGGPDGHLCWNMSSYSDTRNMYETFGTKEE